MIKILVNYLGNSVSFMLADVPFKNWGFEKSSENDLEEPITHYIFPKNGLELRCDRHNKVNTIFLYSDEFLGFDESLLEVPFSFARHQVIEYFGSPSKSGNRINDPILGEYGAWDRFARLNYTIHVEYRANIDRIKQITLNWVGVESPK